jgi:putative sigma-54 modulation protein
MTLSPLDAALRMDLMEHGFYFFTNLETGRPAVLYRRADGDFGLIDESD